jgi:hypothetical protein
MRNVREHESDYVYVHDHDQVDDHVHWTAAAPKAPLPGAR